MAITLNGTTGITTPDVDSTDLTATGNFTSRGIDDNATSTAMTLDTSGKLYVGKTVNSVNTAGTVISSVDGVRSAVSNDVSLILSRLNSDGNLATFYKDGSTVGSIGARGGDAYLETGNTGIRMYDVSDAIIPVGGTGISRNGAIDLGLSNIRFKDLYLSGGVYLGGTGAANKLDDYEVGTWTPTVTAGSITYANAWYIKIGNLVTLGANVWNFSERSSSSGVEINVPFTSVTGPSAIGSMIGSFITSTTGYSSYIGGNQSRVSFYEAPSNTLYEIMKHNDLSSGSDIHFTIAYYTS